MRSIENDSTFGKGLHIHHLLLFVTLQLFVLLHPNQAEAKTCYFNQKIIASNNPFGTCPIGTDTIVIKDTFDINVSYEPIIFGLPFEGILIVDGGVLYWSSNMFLKLGVNACIILIHSGHLYPNSVGNSACNGLKTIYFDTYKRGSCNGMNAQHSFAYVNTMGGIGILDNSCFVPMVNTQTPLATQVKVGSL